jgi:glucan endo-1,3-alpha-glucosidase
MPHDSWRDFLPYYIAKYKGSDFTISKDRVQYWYRSSPAAAGSTCGVTGNSADQGQQEYSPNEVLDDGIFFSALLKDEAHVTVSIGGGPEVNFPGSQGINHWKVPFGGQTGVPHFKVVRSGATIIQGTGLKAITGGTTMSNGCTNYNAFVGSF